MGQDVQTLLAHTNWLDVLGAFIDFVWNLVTQIIIPSLNVIEAAEVGAEAALHITPPGLAADLVVAGLTIALGVAALAATGCLNSG